MSGLRFDLLGGWLCGSFGASRWILRPVATAKPIYATCESCVTGRLRERWAAFALVPALAWARSYGLGEPRATGAAWADDGLDDLSAAE